MGNGLKALAAAAALVISPAALSELPIYQAIYIGPFAGFSLTENGQVAGYSGGAGIDYGFHYANGVTTQLGSLGGDTTVRSINEAGQMVGASGSPLQAILFDGGGLIELGSFGGGWSHAWAVNERGEITGWAGDATGSYQAFIYRNGIMVGLGTLDGAATAGLDINDCGQVAGNSEGGRAFIFSDGLMTDIGNLGGGYANAGKINNAGQISGGSGTQSGDHHAVLYSNGALIDLGTLGGRGSHAYDLSESGHVVGYAWTSSGNGYTVRHAVMWADGIAHDLGTLGGQNSGAWSINDSDTVVGSSDMPDGSQHGFVYANGSMRDLNDVSVPVERIIRAGIQVNNYGQVVGMADGGASAHSYLFTPIRLLFTRLFDAVDALPPGKSLGNTVTMANAYYWADDLQATCGELDEFSKKVKSFSESKKPKLSPDDAARIAADAGAIQVAVGCP